MKKRYFFVKDTTMNSVSFFNIFKVISWKQGEEKHVNQSKETLHDLLQPQRLVHFHLPFS